MPDRLPIPLTPDPVTLGSPEARTLADWPYPDLFVTRLLRDDIPQRVQFGDCRVWVYRDPAGQLVGFGSLDVCTDYADQSEGRPHPYIPLLAVNPTIKSLGYGTTIVRHLIDEATVLASRAGGCHDVLFLDVYTTSEKAIAVYAACGFESITPAPLPDAQDPGKLYLVMAKRLTIGSA